ncbi:MAG TPA: serine/threonine protein kinase [Planctomycetaceae bacterium]|nr:serine/threonine protein kinase [Blastopirellula sp.]HAY81914.1 serine/threonine protein kinase [Planctomycetaceae bacterium]
MLQQTHLRLIRAASLSLVLCALSLMIHAGEPEWPQFRGPQGNGHADAKQLPTKWSETDHVTWKTNLPGRGWSSPVISGRYIWMTTAIEKEASEEEKQQKTQGRSDARSLELASHVTLRALCVDRKSGELLHNIALFELSNPEPIHALNSYASPTPVIVDQRVFCHFGPNGTACLHLETGELIWKTQAFAYDPQNGPGASPVVWRDKLIFHCDGRDVQYAVALDQATGNVVWKSTRSGKLPDNENFRKAYCTPTIIDGDQPQVISPASDWVYSLDPATGKELWRVNYGMLGFSTVPKPIVGNGNVYVLTSYMKSRLLAIRYDGQGDVSESHVAWKEDRNMPSKPSLLLVDKNIYAITDKGIATCLSADTGKRLWTERLGGAFSASPLFAAGHIYVSDQSGQTTVLNPADTLEVVAKNSLDGQIMASPAVADNALFLRTDKALYRIE